MNWLLGDSCGWPTHWRERTRFEVLNCVANGLKSLVNPFCTLVDNGQLTSTCFWGNLPIRWKSCICGRKIRTRSRVRALRSDRLPTRAACCDVFALLMLPFWNRFVATYSLKKRDRGSLAVWSAIRDSEAASPVLHAATDDLARHALNYVVDRRTITGHRPTMRLHSASLTIFSGVWSRRSLSTAKCPTNTTLPSGWR